MIHSGANTSNHSAIYAQLLLGDLAANTEQVVAEKRVDWDKSPEHAKPSYQDILTDLLSDIPAPACAACKDLRCTEHINDLEDYTMDILEAVEAAARDSLAVKGGVAVASKKRVTPGWTDFVKPYQTESLFWHGVWSSANKPSAGPSMMR